ncbi:hypothetical protein BDB00DRAFT_831585 [Zychaea mexicana]|uniref:uncharacterized protein n=1 Tax=Zychaea mexicana TaxID=64656 RepID=UPI0022FDCB69|nr:uncharacterized protein BDB00DRAFT_831585 [Zychaea mexicana]KAI9491642.1 hypothetical protein BDB00DRAFT_831585 [Zychaea mexicana]
MLDVCVMQVMRTIGRMVRCWLFLLILGQWLYHQCYYLAMVVNRMLARSCRCRGCHDSINQKAHDLLLANKEVPVARGQATLESNEPPEQGGLRPAHHRQGHRCRHWPRACC